MTIKRLIVAAIGAAVLFPAAAHSNDRYATPPPVLMSPDLTKPWVMQLQGNQANQPQPVPTSQRPVIVRREREPLQRIVTPQQVKKRTYARAVQPAPQPQAQQTDLNPIYLPQIVTYNGKASPGTIIVDTRDRFLYLVLEGSKARRYGVGVGKPGFEWSGTHKVTRKKEWPSWTPPKEMIKRERAKGRELPNFMPGGPQNPLGARALYLGSTLYRIHGTNAPWTIGGAVSSGCIRMRNEDVTDLYNRVPVGAKVVVI